MSSLMSVQALCYVCYVCQKMSASEKNAFVTKPAMSSRTSSFQRAKHVWITPSSGSEMWRGHGALLRRISATLLTELSGRFNVEICSFVA